MARVVLVGGYAKSLILFRGPLLADLVRHGHEVIACAPDADAETVQSLNSLGVRYESFPVARTGLNPFHDFSTLLALRSLFKRLRPDVFLAYTIKPVIYGSLAARLANVPTRAAMITGLGSAFSGTGLKRGLVGFVAKRLYRLALCDSQVVFFQNPDDKAVFEGLGLLGKRSNAVLINGSGVDVDEFSLSPLPAEPCFLLIARLLGEKGVREYAQAAAQVRRKVPEARFQLIGWIDENPDAISQSELDAWIADETIEFLGRVDDVRPYLKDCSVFVLPSYYPEGTPRTILEAMALGRTIVTADSPGCRETVRGNENGFLVPPRNAAALAEKLLLLSEDAALREKMGRASRAIAEEKYDVRKVNAAILQALDLEEESNTAVKTTE